MSKCSFGVKSNLRGSPQRSTSTLSCSSLPSGTASSGDVGNFRQRLVERGDRLALGLLELREILLELARLRPSAPRRGRRPSRAWRGRFPSRPRCAAPAPPATRRSPRDAYRRARADVRTKARGSGAARPASKAAALSRIHLMSYIENHSAAGARPSSDPASRGHLLPRAGEGARPWLRETMAAPFSRLREKVAPRSGVG